MNKIPTRSSNMMALGLPGRWSVLREAIGLADGCAANAHRVQLLVSDAILWREAKAKAKAAAAKPLPPVQRLGVRQAKVAAQDALVEDLGKKLEASGSLKDAAALLRARRAAR